jgi:hypothetical protein
MIDLYEINLGSDFNATAENSMLDPLHLAYVQPTAHRCIHFPLERNLVAHVTNIVRVLDQEVVKIDHHWCNDHSFPLFTFSTRLVPSACIAAPHLNTYSRPIVRVA